MTESEKEKWLTNIVNLVDNVSDAMGYKTVQFIFETYGAKSLDDLRPEFYEAVFSDLAVIEANIT